MLSGIIVGYGLMSETISFPCTLVVSHWCEQIKVIDCSFKYHVNVLNVKDWWQDVLGPPPLYRNVFSVLKKLASLTPMSNHQLRLFHCCLVISDLGPLGTGEWADPSSRGVFCIELCAWRAIVLFRSYSGLYHLRCAEWFTHGYSLSAWLFCPLSRPTSVSDCCWAWNDHKSDTSLKTPVM